MHIVYMLFIVTFIFLAIVLLMCLFRDKIKGHTINAIMVLSCALFLFSWTYATYENNGLKNGFITFDNISPYICTVISVTPFMNKTMRDLARCCVAFLGLAMFIAMYVNPGTSLLMNYYQGTKFIHVAEAACHLSMGVYGFYLVLSDRVRVTVKNYLKGLAFMFMSIGFVLFLNFIFHRSHFGMDMYGDYSIYFLDIFDSFEITLLAYVIGVLAAMTVGFLVCLGLDKLSREEETDALYSYR